ncbi:hypothetical protein GGS26DRAFT_598221 [Hypomontagnella submonticulosa]|nr:hypothetical protein GGS26DRAFT_598221 [Hypomontagnella submonticulosa]
MRFTNFALAAFSLGSALAAPAVHQPHARALEILGVATTTVSSVKSNVEGELQTINKLLVGVNVNTTSLVPQLEHSLLTIAGEVTKIVGSVLPLVTEEVPALVEGELANLPELLNGKVVNGLGGDVLKAVKPELQLVLSTVEPVAKPILSFALGAVGSTVGPVAEEVHGLVGDLQKVLGGLLQPVAGLLGGVVGGAL